VLTYLLSSRLRKIDPHGWEYLPKPVRTKGYWLKEERAKLFS